MNERFIECKRRNRFLLFLFDFLVGERRMNSVLDLSFSNIYVQMSNRHYPCKSEAQEGN